MLDFMIMPFIIGYLAGSIPFGLLLTQFAGMGDIRNIGSGNIGATNVLRTGSKKLALATLLLDAGKGAAAISVVHMLGYGSPLLVALAAVLGHCFPVWLKFKGGKGVATALGALLAALPLVGIAACATWAVVFFLQRISSLAALTAFCMAPLAAFWFYGEAPVFITSVISVLVIARHHQNIRRLIKGSEPKFGQKEADDHANRAPE